MMDSDQSLSEWSDEENNNTRQNGQILAISASNHFDDYSSSDSEEIFASDTQPKDFHSYNLSEALLKPYVPIRSINQPLIVTQELLIEELRWLLCGARQSEIFLEVDGEIKLHPCCECKEISHGILSSYFQVFFTFVKEFRILQEFASADGHWSRTHEALKLWLNQFISQLLIFITSLQPRSLLDLRVKWIAKMDEIRPIFNCLKTLVNFGPPTITAFDSVTQLLSTAYDCLDRLCFYAENFVLESMLDLLTCLLQPHVNLIDNWLKTGRINDPFREFFVITTHNKKSPFKALPVPCSFLESIFDDLVKASKAKDIMLQMTEAIPPMDNSIGKNNSLYEELLNLIFAETKEESAAPSLSTSTPSWPSHFELATNIPGERRSLMTETFHKRTLRSSLKPLVLKAIASRFHEVVRKRCSVINRDLMTSLETRCHLSSVLSEISIVFSLFALDDLCSVLFEKILDGDTWYDHEMLSSHLQASLLQAGFKDSEKRWSCSATFKSDVLPTEGLKCLESLQFSLKLDWPIDQIIRSRHLEMYNRVSLFLMQLQFSRHVLCTSRFPQNCRSARVSQIDRRLLMLRFDMISFLNAIFSTIVYQIWSTWDANSVLQSPDFEAAVAAHDVLVAKLYQMALQTKNLTILQGPVWSVCKLTVKLRDLLCLDIKATESKVIKIQDEFVKCRKFLLTIIKMRLAAVPQLEGLYYQLAPEADIHDPNNKSVVNLSP